jgi:ADP-heptose:LPS heptosyltransferase
MAKYLIIRFSSIGDIVLTTPVVRCLKRQTGAEVHFLTKNNFRSILEPNIYLSKVHSIEKKVADILPQLHAEQYDAIIDLHHNLRSQQVKWALGTRAYSVDKLNLQKWLIVNLKIDRLPRVHVVDRNLDTLRPLGVVNDGEGLDYFFPEREDIMMQTIAAKLGQLPESGAYLAFAIGAAHQTKQLPAVQVIEVCRQVPRKVILLGGPAERSAGEYIASAAGPHVTNACGLLNLHESSLVTKHAWRVVAPDTGMMHIAAALRKDIVSVWGSTVPEFGVLPYYPASMNRNTTVEIKNLPCRPCTKFGRSRCPKGHFRCMRDIEPGAILQGLEG